MKNNTAKPPKYLSALDEYMNKVYILVLLFVPGAVNVPDWFALIIFDITCLIFLAADIFFIKTGIKDDTFLSINYLQEKYSLYLLCLYSLILSYI